MASGVRVVWGKFLYGLGGRLITFAESGGVIISENLSREDRTLLHLNEYLKLRTRFLENEEYLRFHRKRVLKRQEKLIVHQTEKPHNMKDLDQEVSDRLSRHFTRFCELCIVCNLL